MVALANTGAAPSPADSPDRGSPTQRWASDDASGFGDDERTRTEANEARDAPPSEASMGAAAVAAEAPARPALGAVGLGGTTASDLMSNVPMHDAGARAERAAAAGQTSDAASEAFYSRIAALAGADLLTGMSHAGRYVVTTMHTRLQHCGVSFSLYAHADMPDDAHACFDKWATCVSLCRSRRCSVGTCERRASARQI